MNDMLKYVKMTAEGFRKGNLSIPNRLFSQELGETEAEKDLAKLLRKKFSNYITFVNPHSESGKEIGDVIVILKNSILIFSDKSAESWSNPEEFNSLDQVDSKWSNFYKGIKKSEKQLKNAKKWIKENLTHNKIKFFIDKKCTQEIEFFFEEKIDFFLITTVSGLKNTAQKFLNEDGVLSIDQRENIQSNKKILSTINKFEDENFYNTFDIISLEKLLDYLDTPIDFISYLKFRYNFFLRNNNFKLEREEQILFLYIIEDMEGNIQYEENITEVDFLNMNEKIFEELKDIPFYNDRNKYGKASLIIDDLIDIVTYQHNQDVNYNTDIEHRKRVNKWISLNRRERIAIFLDLEDAINNSKNSKDKSVKSIKIFNNKYFGIYLFYRREGLSDSQYIEHRRKNAKIQVNDLKKQMNDNHNFCEVFFLYMDHPQCELTTITDFYE